jgi:hypothetical protein
MPDPLSGQADLCVSVLQFRNQDRLCKGPSMQWHVENNWIFPGPTAKAFHLRGLSFDNRVNAFGLTAIPEV